MKKTILLGIGVALILIASKSVVYKPSTLVKKDYLENFESLILSIELLEQVLIEQENKEIVQSSYLKTRSKFKSVEIFLSYFDKDFTKKFINGAPLLTLYEGVPSDNVKKPEGFQVIDELIFGEKIDCNLVLNYVTRLKKSLLKIQKLHEGILFTDRFIFEALKQDAIRIGTLGVTGFDTPSSLNAIADAKVNLSCSKTILTHYNHFYFSANNKLSLAIDLLERGIKCLQGKTFLTFDRFLFYKDILLPYQESLTDYHTASGVEKNYETSFSEYSVNQNAKNMFDPLFLNSGFYTDLNTLDEQSSLTKLGRLLFFDPILSENNQRACASCHAPEKAYTDGLAKSLALNFDGHLKRNSPTLINSVYSDRFFWDLRAQKLKKQMDHVVASHQEFNTNYQHIIAKLGSSKEYKDLFKEAFSQDFNNISKNNINLALSAFIQSLTAINSNFDQAIRNEIEVDSEVKEGFNLFMGKAACGTCHFAPIFNGLAPPYYEEMEAEVLGVPISANDSSILDNDLGRYGAGIPQEAVAFHRNSFKTVTVRNSALTAPYMHNGVFNSLDEVLAFYNKGGGVGNGISIDHQTLAEEPLNLDREELFAIKEFLNSLTDTTNLLSKPKRLPKFQNNTTWNLRKIGGEY